MLPSIALLVALVAPAAAYFAPNSTGVRIQHGFEQVLVQPFGYDGFRVRTSAYRPPTGHETSFLYDPPIEGPENGKAHGLTFDTRLNGTQPIVIRNGNMLFKTVGLSGANYWLSFYRIEANGTETLVLNEYIPVKALNPRYIKWNGQTTAFSAEFSFDSTPDEMFFGTGQHQDHLLNQKGQSLDLLNFNSYIPTPVIMSNKGYAFVWNLPSEGRMEFSPYRTRFISEATTVVDYYITAAEPGDYDTLQQRLTAVTGRAPLPPNWTLGYLQSKLRYENESEVIAIAENFKAHDVKVDLIVIDYFSWAYQGDWGLQANLWPDIPRMAAAVKNATGAEMMASLWPSVEDASVNYDVLISQGLLAGTRDGTGITDSFNGSYTRLIDSTNPDARQFLWETLKKNYFDQGIHNFWIDQADGGTLGEAWENNGQSNFITSIPYSRPFTLYATGTQESAGKMYPWSHQQAIEEGLRNMTGMSADDPQCQYVSLSRSTYIGGQRFCSIVWSGDTTSVWPTLAEQITTGLSQASTSGGWWTVDIGGFQTDSTVPWSGNIDRPEYRELFVRWFQWGTFLPFMRVHGSRVCDFQEHYTCDNEPWSYGEANLEITRSYINLRYSLKPYLTAIFKELHETGRMIIRPLFMDFSHSDSNIPKWTRINDEGLEGNFTTQQYMFGPRLLVSPVTLPNVTHWPVYLPKTAGETNGTKPWTFWWSNETYSGGQTVYIPTPIEHIPLFHLGSREDIMTGDVFDRRTKHCSYLQTYVNTV